ncbi:DUF3107 domain-containing protein [Gleimia hominis]|uniref:DUF3107 domain-containing protein n=1 Tax=Gleimia hominis TaxID=595468 RepID=A0ABU3IAB4_9ACTO|nr:DUF3107 domain-containing protein [Gleimia hominis]MDT3767308.1 DUF3107 domain-containing protein [Gleimia hominis]
MKLTIGVAGIARDISLSVDITSEDLRERVNTALAQDATTGTPGVLTLRDTQDREVIIPADKLGYVLLDEDKTNPVGFTVS